MVNKQLVNFIKEARKRGFQDFQIRKPLLDHAWPLTEIEKAFAYISRNHNKERVKYKNKITIFLDNDVLKILDKRANKSLMTTSDLISDILRRSAINANKVKRQDEKLDDMLVALFSRKQTSKKKKNV